MEYLIAALMALVAFLVIRLAMESNRVHRLERVNRDLEARAATADATARRVALAVAPLVEKTDWMTGRWGGKFQQLVAMENARNAKVDVVRGHLMNLPEVREIGFANLLAGSLTEAAEEIWG
jgi:hypothetical protein